MAASSSIEISGLCKAFGAVRAVDCVDLRVEPGELRGLLGPNGAGKTTLLRLLFGLVRPDAGRIAISDGVAGFVEEPRFYPYLSGRRTLELLAELDGGTARARVDEALDLVGLTREAGRRVGGYSTGMRQRLGVAAALLSTPRVLLLDEPTTGLDPSGARELRLLLRSLADDGVTVLLSSHDMDEVADICGSVTIMRSGSSRVGRANGAAPGGGARTGAPPRDERRRACPCQGARRSGASACDRPGTVASS